MRSPDPRNFRPQPSAACWPAQINAADRDRLIVHLADKGWNHSKIGRAVGLTRRGVGMALARIAEGRPGRVRGE